MNNKDYCYHKWIDIAKGIGILLVIAGHTMFPFHEAISIFHMPLFFFLSGLTLKSNQDLDGFLVKKIDRILIPYLFFSVCAFSIFRLIGDQRSDFCGPVWFLQSLFVAVVLSKILVTIIKHKILLCVIIAILAAYCQIMLLNDDTLFPYDKDFDRALRSMVFLLVGYAIKDIIFKDKKTSCNLLLSIVLVVSFVSLCYVDIFKLGAHGTFLNGDICRFNMCLFYITSLVGILAVVFLSKTLQLRLLSRLLKWLGVNSLTIMCIHYPFIQWWNVFISHTEWYLDGGIAAKSTIALLNYFVTIVFCIPFVYFCKRFLPSVTGYKSLLYKRYFS